MVYVVVEVETEVETRTSYLLDKHNCFFHPWSWIGTQTEDSKKKVIFLLKVTQAVVG